MPSRPPVNLTRMRALAYFARSRIASRFGLSSVGWGPCGPPWRPPPRWEDDPPRCPPRPMPPRPWKWCEGVRTFLATVSFLRAVGSLEVVVAYPICHDMFVGCDMMDRVVGSLSWCGCQVWMCGSGRLCGFGLGLAFLFSGSMLSGERKTVLLFWIFKFVKECEKRNIDTQSFGLSLLISFSLRKISSPSFLLST